MNMMSAATDSLKSNCSSSSRTDLLRQYATTESSGQDGTELMKKEATTLTEYMKYITNELKVLDNPKPQCSHTHTHTPMRMPMPNTFRIIVVQYTYMYIRGSSVDGLR